MSDPNDPQSDVQAPDTPATAPSALVNDPANDISAAHIESFAGKVDGSAQQNPASLQVEAGTEITLSWTINGAFDALKLEGSDKQPGKTDTTFKVTPQADTTYVLHAVTGKLEDKKTVDVSVHAKGDVVAPHATLSAQGGLCTIVDEQNLYLDPPVRNLPQYDGRWGGDQIGTIAGTPPCKELNWTNNACNISTATMVLRWFAEDCQAGTTPFPQPLNPVKSIPPTYYSKRFAQVVYPKATPGQVTLDPKHVDVRHIFTFASNYLKTGNGAGPAMAASNYVNDQPKKGWLQLIKDMLKFGPVILGLGSPAGHFVLCHGVIDNGLLIVDPGSVLTQAHASGTFNADWKGVSGYLDGTKDPVKVRMPPPTQWPGGKVPGKERNGADYVLLTGKALKLALTGMGKVISLTQSEGAKLPGPPAQPYVAPPPPAPIGAPGCDQCMAIQLLIGNGVESAIKKGGDDAPSIQALQFHLVQFGYSLGKSGPNKDGVDGDFGSGTAKMLKAFLAASGATGDSSCLTDATANVVLAQHKAQFHAPAAAP